MHFVKTSFFALENLFLICNIYTFAPTVLATLPVRLAYQGESYFLAHDVRKTCHRYQAANCPATVTWALY